MQTSKCPACNSDLIIDDESYENDLVDCANCGEQSEIISLRPIELSLIESRDSIEDEDGVNSEEAVLS